MESVMRALYLFILLGVSNTLHVNKALEYDQSQNVCGTNGVTYDTIIDLHQGKLEDPDLEVLHVGRCHETLSEHLFSDDEDTENETVASNNLNEESENINKDAECTLTNTPVCGTDEKTYVNECFFKAKKTYDQTLRIKHRGPCMENSEILYNGKKTERCTLTFRPVCGTDGKTYSNECLLNYTKKENSKLRIKYRGMCKKQQEKTENQNRETVCGFNYNPVCGNNEITYMNDCVFKKAKTHIPKLRIKHKGPCNRNLKKLKDGNKEIACTLNYNPVCGTDGYTYGNECFLNANKIYHPTLDIKHNGLCTDKSAELEDEIGEPSEELQNGISKGPKCSAVGAPVCGTDGKTYGNKCLLNFNKLYNHKLHIEHSGRCKSKPEEPAKVNSHRCTLIGQMVCGTDGNTYGNRCFLNKRKSKDPTLRLLHYGPCNDGSMKKYAERWRVPEHSASN